MNNNGIISQSRIYKIVKMFDVVALQYPGGVTSVD